MNKHCWIKIDLDNLPYHDVLVANFSDDSKDFNKKAFGILQVRKGAIRSINCVKDDNIVLTECTHYFDINLIERCD